MHEKKGSGSLQPCLPDSKAVVPVGPRRSDIARKVEGRRPSPDPGRETSCAGGLKGSRAVIGRRASGRSVAQAHARKTISILTKARLISERFWASSLERHLARLGTPRCGVHGSPRKDTTIVRTGSGKKKGHLEARIKSRSRRQVEENHSGYGPKRKASGSSWAELAAAWHGHVSRFLGGGGRRGAPRFAVQEAQGIAR